MRLRFILVGLFFALMFTYAGTNAYLALVELRTSSERGWRVNTTGGRVSISAVRHDNPVSVLRPGDEIVAFNDQRMVSRIQLDEFFERAAPGSSYSLVIRRDGEPREFKLQTERFPISYIVNRLVQFLLLPAAFLITGLTIFLVKPRDKLVLLVALMFGSVSYPAVFAVAGLPWWLICVLAMGRVMSLFAFPLGLHVSLLFPEPSPVLRRFPRLEFYLYIPFLLIAFPYAVAHNLLWLISRAQAQEFAARFDLLFTGIAMLFLLYVISWFLVIAITYRRADQLVRRKLRVVIVGLIAGSVPWICLTLAYLLFDLPSRISLITLQWLNVVVYGAMLLVPATFAYAVLRHQVIPVSLIIRLGIQYLLARNALRVLVALPVAGLILSILTNPRRTLDEILLRNSLYFYFLAIITIVFGLLFRKRLSEWIDRKFFREHYNQDKILRELIEDVKKTDSMAEMSQLVSQKVEAALHPERLYLFYREEERRDLSLGYSSGGSERELHIPEEFELLRYIEYQASAQDFPFPQKTNLPQSEKDWLAQLGTKLIVPMTGTDSRLAGLFLLGEKKSEVPYTTPDRQLLETLADQIAIVYENVRLKERVDRDRRMKHEVLARVEARNINLLKECPRCGACFDSTVQFCTSDQAELTLPLPVERAIEGRYRLDRLIGKGGMGAVYEATDIRLNRTVAVKILGGQLFGNTEALRRFEREAQTCARLSHPHIVTVYDYGVLSTEGAYLVMELVRGEPLGSILKRERRLTPAVAAEWLEQVLAAVGAAHGAGIIHRDLKPDNIFIASGVIGAKEQQVVKVLDFGLAKITQHDAADSKSPTSPETTPGAVMGTLGYMSPEQLTGGSVDERTDLFSIGVIAVEVLTGRRPFSGKTYHELLTSILSEPFHLKSNVPEVVRLDEVLQRCLAKDPRDRFTSAAEMQQCLIPAIRLCPILAPDNRVGPEADTAILAK